MREGDPSQPVAARPSATVMLVRDGAAGLEVFMVTRQRPMDGAMGALVFPGGKVDDEDRLDGWGTLAPPQPTPERCYWIAAVRETFEEAGVLLAGHRGPSLQPVDAEHAGRIVAAERLPLLDRKTTFLDVLTRAGMTPALTSMTPFAHWITPEHLPKRFDTHFFLVAAPDGQIPTPDGREMAASRWVAPREILAEAADGRQTLVAATRLNLELLAESDGVDAAMAAARARPIVTVLPRRVETADGPRMTIPGDAGYRTTEFRSSRN